MKKATINHETLEEIGYCISKVSSDLLKSLSLIMFGALLAFLWVTAETDNEE